MATRGALPRGGPSPGSLRPDVLVRERMDPMTSTEPTTTSPPAPLEVKVAHVAKLRRTLGALTGRLADAQAAFDAAHELEKTEIADMQAALTAAEADVRTLAGLEYERTQNKAPAPGVTVKLFTAIEYDRAKVIDWAKAHMPMLVQQVEQLDDKTFKSFVKGNPAACPLAVISETPKVQLATDLETALAAVRGEAPSA